MDLDNITIGNIKQLNELVSGLLTNTPTPGESLNSMVGQRVIVRTYSAGVWFGVLNEKQGGEVILTQARRMWCWHTKKGISLSSVALHGVNHSKSKIVEGVPSVWLEAIEIIPCSPEAIESIQNAPSAEAE